MHVGLYARDLGDRVIPCLKRCQALGIGFLGSRCPGESVAGTQTHQEGRRSQFGMRTGLGKRTYGNLHCAENTIGGSIAIGINSFMQNPQDCKHCCEKQHTQPRSYPQRHSTTADDPASLETGSKTAVAWLVPWLLRGDD